MAFGMEVGLGARHIVLDGDPAPLPRKGAVPPPIFGPFLLWPNGWMHQDATWYGGRPQTRRLCVRWGPRFPFPKKGAEHLPKFLAHFYCRQTAGCIKMPLGMELGLSPGDFVFDADQAPSQKRGGAPLPLKFSAHVYCDQTAGWMKLVLGMEVDLSPIEFVLDEDPALPSSKRGQSPLPNFWPISIVAKRLHASRCHSHLVWR